MPPFPLPLFCHIVYTNSVLHEIVKKIPNGKLIRLKIDADENINGIKITGDFFLSPEESIEEIEKSLIDMPKNSPAEQYAQKIHAALAQQNATFIGVTPEDIAEAIVESFKT